MGEPTKLLWQVEHGTISNGMKDICIMFSSKTGCPTLPTEEEAQANAELIVLAVNNHQSMAFVLRKALLQLRLFQMKQQDATIVLDDKVSELVISEIEDVLEDIGQIY